MRTIFFGGVLSAKSLSAKFVRKNRPQIYLLIFLKIFFKRRSHCGGHRSSADQLITENKNASQQQTNNSSPNNIPQLTIVLMGGPKTGKSALVSQFLWECFLSDYRPTVEEFNWVEYGCIEQKLSGPNFMLQLIDSSGSRDFLAMRHLYYRIADAFMVS